MRLFCEHDSLNKSSYSGVKYMDRSKINACGRDTIKCAV